LVATPPNTISNGKIHGVLKKTKVAITQDNIIVHVIVFLMETPKAITEAYTKNPTAREGTNLKILV
jgi:hypothetical protein